MLIVILALLFHVALSLPKILCLHGGGGSGTGFQNAISHFEDQLRDDYELVFANTPEDGGVWIKDPPGGKNNPTTDPDWAAASVNYLNNIVDNQGPFYGILGYSQGAAMIPVFLSKLTDPASAFQVAMMFCGYIPETHQGLSNGITAASPFGDIRSLHFIGNQDTVIVPDMSVAASEKFTSPRVIRSSQAGHHLPLIGDPALRKVLGWLGVTYTEPVCESISGWSNVKCRRKCRNMNRCITQCNNKCSSACPCNADDKGNSDDTNNPKTCVSTGKSWSKKRCKKKCHNVNRCHRRCDSQCESCSCNSNSGGGNDGGGDDKRRLSRDLMV